MQAKLILIASLATAIIAAVTIGYATLFGASGNFRVYLTSSASTAERTEQWAVSHKNGVVNIQNLIGTATDKKVTQYNSADRNFNLFVTGAGPDEVFHYGCSDKLVSGVDIAAGSLTPLPNGDFAFTSGEFTLLTIKMAGGKPSSVVMDTGVVFNVDKFEYDLEIDMLATNSSIPCDSKYYFPEEPENRRHLDEFSTEGRSADSKWVYLMRRTSYGQWLGNDSPYGGSVKIGGNTFEGYGRTTVNHFGGGKAEASAWKVSLDSREWCGITFTGSDDGGDWLKNMNAIPADCYGGGRCHAGFLSYFNSLKQWVDGRIDDCQNVFFMGHSLGGATAMVAAKYAKSKGKTVRVITAGAPRAFWDYWGTYDVGEVARIVNLNDAVPMAPPSFTGFNHGKNTARVYDWGVVSWSRHCIFWGRVCWSTPNLGHSYRTESDNWSQGWFTVPSVADHMLGPYKGNFEASNLGGLFGL